MSRRHEYDQISRIEYNYCYCINSHFVLFLIFVFKFSLKFQPRNSSVLACKSHFQFTPSGCWGLIHPRNTVDFGTV